eukprot:m.331480 g.331480  ORF g.331480 m.331480 type:complete len:186 (+) comp16738_c0_seq1:100-657(+)
MDAVKEISDKVETFLKENENNDGIFGKAAQGVTKAANSTGVPRAFVLLGGIALVLILFFLSCGMAFLAVLIGSVYPGFMSFKAVESREKDDDTKWLTYWVVFAAFQIVEFFADFIMFWMPFYQWIKIAVLLWCMSPGDKNGSKIIYEQLVKKYIQSKDTIDKIEDSVKNAVDKGADAVKDAVKSD